MFLFLLLLPPVLWLGVVYIGSLLALLVQSFFSIDEFTGLVKREFTLKTYGELLNPANLDIIVRTVSTAVVVTLSAVVIAFPIAFYAARYARGRWKAVFYLGVMLPLWSSYLVKIYAWKLILAKEGILNLDIRQAASFLVTGGSARHSHNRRQFVVRQLHGNVYRIFVRLAPFHDSAVAGIPGKDTFQPA